ncbi:MAG: hypothetical protein FWC66_08355 [Oscillospiraceae bacterium]|nr:hypothetical protein [Oscillospiraceae bacterium]
MIEYIDGSIEFKYSVSKLVTKMIIGVLIAVLGVISAERFMTFLSDLRMEQITQNLADGIMAIPPDPTWAVLVQFVLIAFVVFGVFTSAVSVLNLIVRDRVFLRLTNDGLSHYKFKYHVIKMPHIKESYYEWHEIKDIKTKRALLFGENILLEKSEISMADPKRTIELTISCSENKTEDIIMLMKKKWMGR